MPKPFERALLIVDMLVRREMTAKEIEYNIFGTFGDKNKIRTIQSDINFLESYFGEKLVKIPKNNTNYYTLLTLPQSMYELYAVPPEDVKRVYEFIGLFDADMLKLFEEESPKVIEGIRKDTEQCYTMINKPFEHRENTEILKTIKKAILKKHKLSIGYRKEELIAYNHVIPLKIIFIHNNWYLAILVEDKSYIFTLLRIGHIVSADMESNNGSGFGKTAQVKATYRHIEQLQSPYDSFGVKKYEVQLLVKAKVASYFELKKYLASQQIKKQSNGSLIVTYQINNDEEILPIIKQWIPDIYVIKPKKLQETVHNMLSKYIKNESQFTK